MSATIDSKVVEMRFDNKNFESNASTTISTLGRLKQALNLSGSSKGLNDVSRAATNTHTPMLGLSSAVETVRNKFSALEVMGVTALANITNSAVNAGKKIASSLTVEPIKLGFQEYETQMNAVQTIMANTSSKGTTLKDVNSALDELNTYADKTIYNFTEMTRNIGTFTAAGVDLDTSVSAIKGIANLAAVSGSTSQQASTAMYQLSQALANGKVNLMDWNSVVNAGMGGEVFQNALKRTAKNKGTDVDALIKKYGSFRESLTKGEWLTTDVLTETLEQFTMAAEEGSEEWNKFKKSLMDDGYTEKQAVEILKMANTATDAATKVKTLTQLWDTLKEAAQSGWAQSWKIIVGDFEEAKALFTEISDTLGAMIGNSAQSRNEVLQGWKDMGGRTALVDSLKNAFEGVMSVIKPIKEAFREVFPPVTAETLYNLTQNLKKFTEGLKLSGETSDKVKRIFKGLFSIVDIVRKVITAATKALFGLSQSEGVGSLADFLLDTAASIGDFFTSLNEGFDAGGIYGVFSVLGSTISKTLEFITGGLSGLGDALSAVGSWIGNTVKKIWEPIKNLFTWLSDTISPGDIFAALAGGGVFVAAGKLSGVFDSISEGINKIFGTDGSGGLLKTVSDSFCGVLDNVGAALQAFTGAVRVWALLGIAAAVALLSSSMEKISALNGVAIAKSIFSIGMMISMLTLSFKSMTKSLKKFEGSGILKSAIALVFVAKAVDILADVMAKIGSLPFSQILKGLVGIAGAVIILCVALKRIDQSKISLSTSAAILALAYSCKILGDALTKFGEMSWAEIGRGLVAMGGALAEVVVAVIALDKFAGKGSLSSSAAVFIVVQSLSDLADALKEFGKMSWSEIGRGLAAMGGALLEVGAVVTAVGKIAGFSSIFGAGAIWIVIQGLGDLANALKKFGKMSWSEIGRGLTAMGGALAEVGVVAGALGYLTGISGILGAAAIWIAVQGLQDLYTAFKDFGSMEWDEIGKGLVAMGGALVEVGVVSGALGYLTGISGVLGATAIWISVQGLQDLYTAFKDFGSMEWDEIGKGLVAMGGALVEVSVVSGALGYLTGISGILGGTAIWISVQGLQDLYAGLKDFGSMEWEDVKTGLAAMGGALGVLALGSFANTLSAIGGLSISLVVDDLDDLANALKKYADMSWEDVKTGLAAMMGALGGLAVGSFANTLSTIGAWSISIVAGDLIYLAEALKVFGSMSSEEIEAGATAINDALTALAGGALANTLSLIGAWSIAAVAEPLGVLADSVKKWVDIKVPDNLESNLGAIANGIEQFSWLFLAGWSIGAIADPLWDLAEAVKHWDGVTVPENLGSNLGSLASAIKQFSWLFLAGWSIGAIADPLWYLADSVNHWDGVTMPKNIESDLTSLAKGVQSFSFAFLGGWSMSAVVTPLKNLADSVKAWNDVSVPDGLGQDLLDLSGALFAAIPGGLASVVIDEGLITKIKNLGVAVSTWAGITIPGDIKTKLTDLSNGIKAFNGLSITTEQTSAMQKLSTAASQLSDLNWKNINDGIKSFGQALVDFSKIKVSDLTGLETMVDSILELAEEAILNTNKYTTLATSIVEAISKGFESAQNTIKTSITTLMDGMATTITDSASTVADGFATGITDKETTVKTAWTDLLDSCITAVTSYKDDFSSAGSDLVTGFANGISANSFKAVAQAKAMAELAITAARTALSINSPSRVFRAIGAGVPEGFAQGISKFGNLVRSAVVNMSDVAITGTKRAISSIADVIGDDINTQPTIRPVVDLSNVRAGAEAVSGMFSATPSVDLLTNIGSINSTMNRRFQNGGNEEVVSAINDLKKSLANISGDTYSINGITYDDGSNINDAVRTLVRAARIERRT